jgi:NAD(P)-dependent dehydrogenase (short-subunit alcohol dehydrogenase family)
MSTPPICQGRVAIVTGAGQGIGREHALEFARQGARVVVNDLSAEWAAATAEHIRAAGGEAVANGDDVGSWAGAGQIVAAALDHWGRLDVLVNNAGIVRDRMFANISEAEWDEVIRVHLKGHAATARHAAEHWRGRAKAGERLAARIINTSSGAGLQGSTGQSNYAAAKAGIATLTLVQAAELGRYGVTANAIAPAARTRMTEATFSEAMKAPAAGFDAMHPANIAPLVVWLGSAESSDVTGRVFEVAGGRIAVANGWCPGPAVDKRARWHPAEVGPAVRELLVQAPAPAPVYGAR